MPSDLEMKLLEKLELGSYIGIQRGDTYVGKLVRYEGFSNLNIKVKTRSIEGYVPVLSIGIISTDKIILGEEIFKEFGGEKGFRHALLSSPYKRKGFTREELKYMYSEEINGIVNNIKETARKFREMKKTLPKPDKN